MAGAPVTASDHLAAAMQLLALKGRSKEYLASHKQSRPVDPLGTTEVNLKTKEEKFYPATEYSILGALMAANSSNTSWHPGAYAALSSALRAQGFLFITHFELRRETKGEDVVALLNQAIEIAQQGE